MTMTHLCFEIITMSKQHNTAICIVDKVTSHHLYWLTVVLEWDHRCVTQSDVYLICACLLAGHQAQVLSERPQPDFLWPLLGLVPVNCI